MAKENIRKNEEIEKDEKSTQNEYLKNLIKNKMIIYAIIILAICIIICIINNVFKKNSEIIQNIEYGKKELIIDKKELPIDENKEIPMVEKIILKKHNQELVEDLKDVNKKIYEFLSMTNYYNKYVDDENIIEKVKNLKEKYYTYLNITRFAIPVIGSVSVGKSTLLNYILNLKNFLETGIDITTRFLCIIRHNINYKSPVISNITIEERNLLKYNFIKDLIISENEYGNDYIKKYNKFFSLKENKGLKIEEKYFLLIEVDIPFFHGEFEKYADLIEFIDIPGLNEIDSRNFNDKNIYFSQIIPFIQPNYLFSIFLFDLNNFQSKDAKDILLNFTDVNYLDCVEQNLENEKYLRKININKVFKESIFILNKKNRNYNESYLQEFKDCLYKIFADNEININLEEDENIFEINLKRLNLELNRFNSFEDYLNYSIYNKELSLIESITNHLNKDFKLNLNYINLTKSERIDLNKNEEEEFVKINKIISPDKLKQNQFKQLYDIFNKNVLNVNKNNNKYDIYSELIKNKIKALINDYMNVEEFYKLKIQYQNFFKEKGINDLKLNYHKILKIKNNNITLKNPKEFINDFDKYMKELNDLKGDDNNQAIESLNNKFNEIKGYSSKKFLSSLLLIGEYSSGKSSFINSLIGQNLNLLQVKTTECTKIAVIVRYTDNKKNISLYSAKLKENKNYGFYFVENKLIAKGPKNVKNKIVELNAIQELNYYILYTPIQAYDDLNFEKELKYKIELIDFPGLASFYNDKVEKEIKKLLKNENAFIFVKNGKEFNVGQSYRTINLIYNIISKKDYFYINNCLFLFTFPRYNNYDMNEVKKDLFQIFDDQTIDKCMIKRKLNKNNINENKLIISKFDSPLYEDYLKFSELINDFKLFTENVINFYKKNRNNNEFYQYFKFFLSSGNYINFDEVYSTREIEDKNDMEKYGYLLDDILKNNSIKLNKNEKKVYLEYYLKIKENKKLYSSFEYSNYEGTIQQLKKIIVNIEIMLNETLNYHIYDFSKEIFNLFSDIQNIIFKQNLFSTQGDVREIKQKINEIINNLENTYTIEKNKILKEFTITKKNIDKITINDFNYDDGEKFENSINKTVQRYEEMLEDLDNHIEDHIEYFQNKSKKELNSLEYNNKFKDYFKGISKEYIEIIQIIDEKISQSQENFKKEEYNEYNYYNSEDYKKSHWSKSYKYIKGFYNNFMHNFTEDRKNYSEKTIKEFKNHFKKKKTFFLKSIDNIYNKVNNKINRYKEFFNSKWKNIIKNKKKYLDLSKKIISFLEEKLNNN